MSDKFIYGDEKMDKVIPVVVIKDVKDTIPTLKALRDGGVNCAEITFRTECAPDAIKLGVETFPDMNIGAGTVINEEQAKKAIDCGAKFIVSPGLSVEVAKYTKECNVDYFPGCVTPTEIMQAIALGINVVKFFPANVYGGLKALKALSAPFPQIKFIPTGGVDLSNLSEFLEFEKVYAVGGSFMMKGDIVANCQEINKIVKG
ncbi:MAG: bifunctional 4-hydroxy-2-oxoglutarate aldolase/2-dehydro-3-deoxy-phosphogluconate aldolase [Clostridia bacterium]|nr:bifunctional 4-hydroxy-2-oxoglutarate aldolase/2-dehydro-3-deoxy-phosphogluconate aldolase [Clostridia bacterium]